MPLFCSFDQGREFYYLGAYCESDLIDRIWIDFKLDVIARFNQGNHAAMSGKTRNIANGQDGKVLEGIQQGWQPL